MMRIDQALLHGTWASIESMLNKICFVLVAVLVVQ